MSDSDSLPGAGEPGPSVHRPVLLRETIDRLALEPGLTVVDGTVGGGGHSRKILEHIGEEGTLIGLDRDPMMLRFAARALSGPNCHLRQASYAETREVLDSLGIAAADRILLDLGLSSDQLVDEGRGFGFQSEGPLDLRFDVSRGRAAWELIEQAGEAELAGILERYGEEPFSGPIASRLVQRRRSNPIRTARDLVAAVEDAVPRRLQREARKHPATRVFQALRIAVNDELRQLEMMLDRVLPVSLAAGGRAVVITFHSLEDRLVKEAFRRQDRWQNLTSRPVTPLPLEQKMNPRSRSARLRAAARK